MNAPSTFIAALPEARQAGAAQEPGLGESLAAVLDRARAAWPQLRFDEDGFVRHVARHMPPTGEFGTTLAAMKADDLFLAWGCAVGDARAIEQLRQVHLSGIGQALHRLRKAESEGDEIESRLLEHILVGVGGRLPRISEYSGRGSLRGWLQVAATRLLLTGLRGGSNEAVDDSVLLDLPSPMTSPEMDALKNRYRDQFNEALREAIGSLSPRERNLLRQHYLDGLTTAELATLYRVNRATAVRWLAAARDALLSTMRDRAVNRLGVRPQDFESLLPVMRSQLNVSLPVFLSRA